VGVRSPFQVRLTEQERWTLQGRVRRPTTQHRQVLRAQIVLTAADGQTNVQIARRLGITPSTARKWRRRFCAEGLDGLGDRHRSGRPRVFPAAVVAEAKAVACAGRRPDQALAAPLVDLSPRPRLRRQGRTGAGPL
jgi:transposase-like protein